MTELEDLDVAAGSEQKGQRQLSSFFLLGKDKYADLWCDCGL